MKNGPWSAFAPSSRQETDPSTGFMPVLHCMELCYIQWFSSYLPGSHKDRQLLHNCALELEERKVPERVPKHGSFSCSLHSPSNVSESAGFRGKRSLHNIS